MAWGLWLLAPWWNTFTTLSPAYSYMRHIAPEEYWGAYFFVFGLLLLVGALWRRRSLSAVGAVGVLWGRLFVGVLTGLASGWQAAGVPDFTIWAILATVCLMRALQNGE